jgi:hypothetical protein
VQFIERKIEWQNIYAGLTEHSKITSISFLLHKPPNFVFAQATSFRYASDLQLGIMQADVRIESAA